MSYLSAFRNDIFISYSRIDDDDQPFFKEHEGWVSSFRQTLLIRLHQLLGSKPSIWLGPKLQDDDWLSDEKVLKEISSSAIFACILSPRYLKSESCLKELDVFCKSADSTGGLIIQNHSRVLKVIKTPVAEYAIPEPLMDTLGYKFYEIDPDRKIPRELGYYKKIETFEDIAYDIYEMLQMQKKRLEGPSYETKASVNTSAIIKAANEEETFLSYARTNKEIMESVRKILESRGLTVWTDEALTPGTPDWEEAIEKNIENSNCVIVIFSPEAKNSKWIRSELAYADVQNKTIYPLLASGDVKDSVPLRFINAQYMDIRPPIDVEKTIEELCNIINETYSSNSESDTRDKS
jgi:hypothetical protein